MGAKHHRELDLLILKIRKLLSLTCACHCDRLFNSNVFQCKGYVWFYVLMSGGSGDV